VAALEPSTLMLRQRPDTAAPAVRGVAEALPFPGDAFDAAMAILTVHHWRDQLAGLAEMCRVAPRRVALVFDQDVSESFWLYRDYMPASNAIEADRAPRVEMVADALDADRVEIVPVPHDCTDGFGGAYWRRPEAYLDPAVRAGISSLAVLDPRDLEPSLSRLRADLESGVWHERHADLLQHEEIDLGYRLVVRA
jgi:SAM-dependent methyltransferase